MAATGQLVYLRYVILHWRSACLSSWEQEAFQDDLSLLV